jgi:hypothetical protein
MFDPVSIGAAMSTANLAFNGIKRAFAAGRDLEAMTGDLSRWMGAVSDVGNIEKRAKNPPLFSKMFNGQSIEQEAIEAFAAKKKLEAQREELKTFLMFTHGTKAWDELIAMEGTIRKRRQLEVYQKQERRDKIVTYSVVTVVLIIGAGILSLVGYGLVKLDRSS